MALCVVVQVTKYSNSSLTIITGLFINVMMYLYICRTTVLAYLWTAVVLEDYPKHKNSTNLQLPDLLLMVCVGSCTVEAAGFVRRPAAYDRTIGVAP